MHAVGTQSVVWSAWLTAAVVLLSFSSGYLRSSFFHCLRWGAGQPYWRGLVSVGWTGWVSIESAQTERSHQCREARMPTPDVCTNIHLTACKMVAVTRLSYRWNCLFCKYQHPCCHFGQNRKHHTGRKEGRNISLDARRCIRSTHWWKRTRTIASLTWFFCILHVCHCGASGAGGGR